jgi:hypothetical protein
MVKAAKPTTLVSGNVAANGKVTGARVTGGRKSLGVYTLTISGNTFLPAASSRHLRDKVEAVLFTAPGQRAVPSQCEVASEQLAANGGATSEVDCFTLDPAAGWQPTDSAFDFQMEGPSR